MISTDRLLHLFGQLTKEEQSTIEIKLIALTGKDSEKLQGLFSFLIKKEKAGMLNKLNPDILSTHLFPEKIKSNKKKSKKELSRLLLILIKLIEDKLILQAIESEDLLREKLLLNTFSKRHLKALWYDEFKKLERKIKHTEKEPKEKKLEVQKYLFDSRMSYFELLKNESRITRFDLDQATNDLDKYLIISKLRHLNY